MSFNKTVSSFFFFLPHFPFFPLSIRFCKLTSSSSSFFSATLLQAMALAHPFDMIKDLNETKYLWKIAVRIVDLWYVQKPPKPGHLEMILMDSKGDMIQVTVKKDEFLEWSEKLNEDGTTLKEKDFPDIPHFQYQFKSFGDILGGKLRKDLLVDVIGAVHEIVSSQPNADPKMVEFTIKNHSGELLSCTLWNELAIKFLKSYDKTSKSQLCVAILTHARIKNPEGKYAAGVSNDWNGSKLLIDEEIVEIQNFKSRFSEVEGVEPSSQRLSQISSHSQFSEEDRFMYKAKVMTILEINSVTNMEEINCVTVGITVMFITGKNGWYMKDVHGAIERLRYNFDIQVVYKKGSGRFIFWENQCADIMGVTTADLRDKMLQVGEDDPRVYPELLDMMLARTMALRVRVQPTYKKNSVIKLSEKPNMIHAIEDQFIIDEQCLSATADYEPDFLGSVTPAKRMSVEPHVDEILSQDVVPAQLSTTKASKMTKHIKSE